MLLRQGLYQFWEVLVKLQLSTWMGFRFAIFLGETLYPSLLGGINLQQSAGLHDSMGSYSKAEPLYLRTVGIFMQALGQDHPNTQTVLGNFLYFIQQAVENGQAAALSNHPITQAILEQRQA